MENKTLPESVYESKIRDKKFHIKNFLIHYKKLVDVDRLKNDNKNYINDLGKVNKLLPKDILNSRTVLFVFKENISKLLFLSYASRFGKLKSFYYCPIQILNDIFWGVYREGDFGEIPEGILYSETSIREDLFFLYCDRDVETTKKIDYVSSTISYRLDINEKCRNILFYRGTVEDMKTYEWSSNIYNSFIRNGYRIVDLNDIGSEEVIKNFKHSPTKSLIGDTDIDKVVY